MSAATFIETDELLFARFGSVVEADSPTKPVLVMVVLAVPAFTKAAMAKVAVELAGISPIVQIPVEVA